MKLWISDKHASSWVSAWLTPLPSIWGTSPARDLASLDDPIQLMVFSVLTCPLFPHSS